MMRLRLFFNNNRIYASRIDSLTNRSFVFLVSFLFLMVCVCLFPMTAQAKPVTLDATITSYGETSLSAKVVYDDEISPDAPVRFTFDVSGGNYELQYKLYNFEVTTSSGLTRDVVDATKYGYSTSNTLDVSLITAGEYKLAFYVIDFMDVGDGTKKAADSARFQVTFSVLDEAGFESLESKIERIYGQCVSECGSDASEYEIALWFNDWLVKNATYDKDMVFNSADGVLIRGKGTCESFHAAYVMLLNRAGIETRRVDSYGDAHVWTGVKLDGEWYNVDVTWNDYGVMYDGLDTSRLYFAVPSNIMKLVHRNWDGNYLVRYPDRAVFDAHAYEDNYFIKSGEIAKFADVYLDSPHGEYSVKAHLAQSETEFQVPIVKSNWPADYKNVIYTLVAYRLEQVDWGDSIAELAVAYSEDRLCFSVTYVEPTPEPEPAPELQTQAMHRLYNPYSGEHFYTSSDKEKNDVVAAGWSYEGIGWNAPTTGKPVYRLYNIYGGEHHYTLSESEKIMLINAGWNDEGIGWYSDINESVPLYRQYNPYAFSNNHNYTADRPEHDWLVGLGWLDEGIGWYGVRER